jgi:hypothetical protein
MIIYFGFQKLQEWNAFWKFPMLCTYIVSTFVIFKSFFDGGLFSAEFVVFFSALCCALKVKDDSVSQALHIFSRYLVMCFGAVILTYDFASPDRIPFFLHDFSGSLLVLFLMNTTIFLIRTHGKNLLINGLFLFLCIALVFVLIDHFWFHEFLRMTQTYGPGDKVYVLDKTGGPIQGSVKYQEGAFRIYVTTIGTVKKNALDFCRENRLPAYYNLATVVNRDCAENIPFPVSGKIRVVQGSHPVLDLKSEACESFLISPCIDQRECDYSYSGIIKGCIPNDAEAIVINHLTRSGFKKFILIADRIEATTKNPGD